ncbi:hypothetical protein HW115_18105 [Verrucomicrobiaceae bacterium N1E253]|uniref:Uncharacterized protein n=1 Tax=Oceaniferula marina TaxID=2748318 RepID=A0A851GRB0_9BACT|nr:hypothetical protein [Oceaniferula marina]NWK57537.1 hypothetical protein [Oceaniferula marina]
MSKDPEPTWLERMAARRPPYFWWFLGFIVASCFAFLSWSLCIAIFSAPEIPRNYEILKKVGRLPEHKAYTSQTAPSLPSSPAPVLRNSYLEFSDEELATVNRSLLHSYLTNFRTNTFCSYLVGPYRVTNTRKLTDEDIMNEGFAIQLRSYLQPDEYNKIAPYPVIIEILFPTPYPESYQGYHIGDNIELDVTPYFASLLYVSKVEQEDDDTIVRLTAVSLAQKIRPPHAGPFDLAPPTELNLHAPLPLFSGDIPKAEAPASTAPASAP